MIRKHNLSAPEGLLHCDTVWDVGPGIRPMNWWKPKRHFCVEPHTTYRKHLKEAGYETLGLTAQEFARRAIAEDKYLEQVVMLDVIEHLTRPDAEQVIHDLAFQVHKQLVIYTPVGFMEQDGGEEEDPWGLDGQEWQKHRCGFLPDDDIFKRNGFVTGQKHGKGFFAILTR
jgi:hypothetical protein